MPEVKGIVTADTLNVRVGYKTTADKSPVGPLKKGQEVIITGFAIDPDGEEFKLRYQIMVNQKTLWTTAKFVSVDPLMVKNIPFIALSERAAEELLESTGMDVKDGIEIPFEQAQEIAALLRDFKLSGSWDLEGILNLRELIEHLHDYGVTLGSVDGGAWTMADLRKVRQAVDGIAEGTGQLFGEIYGSRSDSLAFRLLYAPLHITRSGKNNVSPWPEKETWFAKNGNGYEIVLGNKVFFEGITFTRSNPKMPYTSVELIAHEIGHVINWRYSLKTPKGQVLRPREFYETFLIDKRVILPTGETVALTMNDGYRFAARSSNGPHETVTDAIVNFSMNRLTDDDPDPVKRRQGQARRLQLADMMKRIIKYRMEMYSGIEGIRAAILKIGGVNLETSLQSALDLLKRPTANLDEQVTEFKKSTISFG
jgi:hypothetical protein